MTSKLRSLALLAAGVLSISAHAAKITVGEGGIATIQDAVDAALANGDATDIVLAPGGTYQESIFVSFSGAPGQEQLTIRAAGGGSVRITGVSPSPAIELQDVDGVILQDLELDSGGIDAVPALLISGASRDVDVRDVIGAPGDDLGAVTTAGTFGVRFDGCDFSAMLGRGFTIDGASHTLTGCRASSCGLNGLVLAATSRNVAVDGFEADAVGGSDAAQRGVITVHGEGHRISNCRATGGGLDGFFVDGSGHLLDGCEGSDNLQSGFNVDDAPVVLQGCDASGNLFGFRGGRGMVEGGTSRANASHGIVLDQDGMHVVGVAADGNGGHGVFVLAGVSGGTVRGSSMKGNGGEGVLVQGDQTWVEGNVAKKGDGFVDDGTDNGGRDNKVKGNATNDF